MDELAFFKKMRENKDTQDCTRGIWKVLSMVFLSQ